MYIKIIKNIAIMNKYTSWYISIIQNAQNRATTRKDANLILGYSEGHHILPKCISSLVESKDSKNIVYLSFREHVVCHLILTKMFVGNIKYKMQHACNAFNFKLHNIQKIEKTKISSKTLELLKLEYIKERKRIKGESHHRYGKFHTIETKTKMRKPKSDTSNMNKHIGTQKVRDAISKGRKGKGIGANNAMASEENRAKVGASKIGRKIAINLITKERKYVFPDNIPDGFILKYLTV